MRPAHNGERFAAAVAFLFDALIAGVVAVVLLAAFGAFAPAAAQPAGWGPGSPSPLPVNSPWTYSCPEYFVADNPFTMAACSGYSGSHLPNDVDCELIDDGAYRGVTGTCTRPVYVTSINDNPLPAWLAPSDPPGDAPPGSYALTWQDSLEASGLVLLSWATAFAIRFLAIAVRGHGD